MRTNKRKFLTPDDLAERLDLPRRLVVTGPLRHELPWLKVGKSLRLDPAALENFLTAQQRRGQ